jgi:hypothetical protein
MTSAWLPGISNQQPNSSLAVGLLDLLFFSASSASFRRLLPLLAVLLFPPTSASATGETAAIPTGLPLSKLIHPRGSAGLYCFNRPAGYRQDSSTGQLLQRNRQSPLSGRGSFWYDLPAFPLHHLASVCRHSTLPFSPLSFPSKLHSHLDISTNVEPDISRGFTSRLG